MTIPQLQQILSLLKWARSTESCADAMMDKELDEAINWLRVELKLK